MNIISLIKIFHLEKNFQTAQVLKEQMQVLERQKEEEKRLKETLI